ncbi:MAG: tetratricopeptide repeat protein [Cyanobacteria bacterium P01_F01_bin.53]
MGDTKIYNIENIGTAQFFSQSLDYQSLMARLAENQEMLEYLQATGKTERALKAGGELAELEAQLERLKEDVLRLYETFTKIEIDTERLAKAKAHFDKGEFREADAILDAETMAQDLERLLERDQQLDAEKAAITKNREQLSNEYLVKARLRATFYEQPNRFEEACAHFESALSAVRTSAAIFEYAVFLQNHNSFKRARALYDEALQSYRELAKETPKTYIPDVARTLNNLANLQSTQNDYEKAASNYDEALRIYQELAQENPRTYLPYVAGTLNNLAVLQKAQNDYEKATSSYDEALRSYRELAQENPRT